MPSAEESSAAFELCAEIETGVRWLVVAYVLHDKRVAIDGVGEEGMEAVFRGNGRDVKAEMAIVGCACQHFLSPVAKDVRAEGRIALGAVVEGAIGELG